MKRAAHKKEERSMWNNRWIILLFALAIVGFADSAYLTKEHYSNVIPPCSLSIFVDCGKVLRSEYAMIFGIPLAVLGLIHYSVLFFLIVIALRSKNPIWKRFVFLQTAIGVLASAYFVYLQLGVIRAICLYCMVSAITSFMLYFVARVAFREEYHKVWLTKKRILNNYFLPYFSRKEKKK